MNAKPKDQKRDQNPHRARGATGSALHYFTGTIKEGAVLGHAVDAAPMSGYDILLATLGCLARQARAFVWRVEKYEPGSQGGMD
jgi:hypothetical protein